MTQQPTRWSMVEPIGRVPFQARMNPKLKDDIYDMARIEGKHIYEITEDAFRHQWILFVGENDLIDPDEFNQAVSDIQEGKKSSFIVSKGIAIKLMNDIIKFGRSGQRERNMSKKLDWVFKQNAKVGAVGLLTLATQGTGGLMSKLTSLSSLRSV